MTTEVVNTSVCRSFCRLWQSARPLPRSCRDIHQPRPTTLKRIKERDSMNEKLPQQASEIDPRQTSHINPRKKCSWEALVSEISLLQSVFTSSCSLTDLQKLQDIFTKPAYMQISNHIWMENISFLSFNSYKVTFFFPDLHLLLLAALIGAIS